VYIDPAAGSVILQVVAAAAVTGLAMVGRVREALRSFFSSMFSRRHSHK
jgi:hypothetical protein